MTNAHIVSVTGRARGQLALAAELIRAVRLLHGKSVPALALKGPALALCLRGDLASRRYRDIDILVHPRTAPLAFETLAAAGYTGLAWSATRPEWRALSATGSHIPTYRARTAYRIELHWNLSPPELPCRFKFSELWKRSVEVDLAGTRIKTLSFEDNAIYLSLHGFKHQWERLGWLADIAALAPRDDVDWDVVVARARSMGFLRIVLSALQLAHDVMDAPIPTPCARALRREPKAGEIASELRARIAPHWSRGIPAPPLRRWEPLVLKSRDRWADRVRHLLHPILAPTPADVAAVPLPEALFAAYYLIRPIRLVLKYARLSIQALSRNLGLHTAPAR